MQKRRMSCPELRLDSKEKKEQMRGYKDVCVIGRGSYGTAHLVYDPVGELRVMKKIDVRSLGKHQQTEALNEVKVLSSLKHPYVVRYHESFVDNGVLSIVMDYCEGGDLHKKIGRQRQSRQQFPEHQIVRWFTQVALALKHLHAKQVTHRDLKPQNIFLTKNEDVRIGDFGISKNKENTMQQEESTIGTPYYFSPEICSDKLYTFASDIWALGCVLFELAALRVPFEAQSLPALVSKITKGSAPALPQCYSADLRQACSDLLCRDYSRRPTSAEVMQWPFVKGEMHRMLREASNPPSQASTALPSVASSPFSLTPIKGSELDGTIHAPPFKAPPSPSFKAPPSPAARNTLRQSGSSALISSSGALQSPSRSSLLQKELLHKDKAAVRATSVSGGNADHGNHADHVHDVLSGSKPFGAKVSPPFLGQSLTPARCGTPIMPMRCGTPGFTGLPNRRRSSAFTNRFQVGHL
mmetsp:Transcript_14056/g.24692  ORF Transcript_14056/g.24692 Transcript_14056/m.24692 type:complete len:468 (+) Transcript_14056:2-1405(+)